MKAHGVTNVDIACTVKDAEGRCCDWHCGFSLDCYLEHSRHIHREFFLDGASHVFNVDNGFRLLKGYQGPGHSDICLVGKKHHKQLKNREVKKRYNLKHGKGRCIPTTSSNNFVEEADVEEDAKPKPAMRKSKSVKRKRGDGEACKLAKEQPAIKRKKVITIPTKEVASTPVKNVITPARNVIIKQNLPPFSMPLDELPKGFGHIDWPLGVVSAGASEDSSVNVTVEDVVEVVDISDSSEDEDEELAAIQASLDLDLDAEDDDAEEIEIGERTYNLKDGVEWLNQFERNTGFERIINQLGKGDMQLGGVVLLERVMAATEISAGEHATLLINWQLNKLRGAGSSGKKSK